MQSEVLQMQLSQVDLAAGTLRLDPGTTKNREGRTVYLTPELITLVSEQVERARESLISQTQSGHTLFVPNPRKGRFQGSRLQDFRKAWLTACKKAGRSGCFGMISDAAP